MQQTTLKEELQTLVKKMVRKGEVKRLIERLYCQYIDDTEYSSKDFEEIQSLYIKIKSFYIYVEFKIEDAELKGSGSDAYYCSDKVYMFKSALERITNGNIICRLEECNLKGQYYIVKLYFSNEYEIEVLE